METGAITQYVDVAQIVLYMFWIFFAGLIYYLVREGHREGYPMDNGHLQGGPVQTGWPVPEPKVFKHDVLHAEGCCAQAHGPQKTAHFWQGHQHAPLLGKPIGFALTATTAACLLFPQRQQVERSHQHRATLHHLNEFLWREISE